MKRKEEKSRIKNRRRKKIQKKRKESNPHKASAMPLSLAVEISAEDVVNGHALVGTSQHANGLRPAAVVAQLVANHTVGWIDRMGSYRIMVLIVLSHEEVGVGWLTAINLTYPFGYIPKVLAWSISFHLRCE